MVEASAGTWLLPNHVMKTTLPRRIPTDARHLTHRQRDRLVEEYLLDLDIGAASQRAGVPADLAIRMLGGATMQRAIRIAKAQRQTRTEIYSDEVLRRWYMLATADAREVSAPVRVNCRHCHGIDHRYQFTLDELRTARLAHEIQQRRIPKEVHRVAFDDLGGDGFDPWGDPDPGCTECGGKGVLAVWVEDARNLSPAAALLYDGVEVGKDGSVKVKMRDRGWADQMVAAHLGIGPRRGAVPVDPAHMSDEQLDQTIQQFAVNLSEDEFRRVAEVVDESTVE